MDSSETSSSQTLPPPPRNLKWRRGVRSRLWARRLFIIPFVAIGCFLLWMLLMPTVVNYLGTDLTSRIVDIESSNSRYVRVTFRYVTSNGEEQTGSKRIDTQNTSKPEIGQEIPLRVLTIGPYHPTQLRDARRGLCSDCCFGLFTMVWCLLVLREASVAWIGPVFQRKMIRDGEATTAIVKSKQLKSSGRSSYKEITYAYQSSDGKDQSGSSAVSNEIYDTLQPGDSVIVIYEKTSPQFSTMYIASLFEVI